MDQLVHDIQLTQDLVCMLRIMRTYNPKTSIKYLNFKFFKF